MLNIKLQSAQFSVVSILIALGCGQAAVAQQPFAKATEDERAIKIETDKLEAVIPKNHPKHWMTGIEKGSFLDKTTGFREAGDGLMVVDWLMEAGSDEAWADKVIAPDGNGVGRYTWYANETEPGRRDYALMAHGSSHRKRMVEGPQLCHRMKPVRPEVIRGPDFLAVKTTYQYEYAAPSRKPGSRWTQLVVFPKGERYFLLMDRIDSVNDSEEMFLRGDMPGCVRHDKGDTFSEIYLSYLSGPNGGPHSVSRVLHPVPARPEVRLPPRHAPDAGALHPCLPPAGSQNGQGRPLAGRSNARPRRGLRGVVQPASGRDHRHDRGDPRQAGEGRRVLQRRPRRGLLRQHRRDAQGQRPLQGPHRPDRRRLGLAAGEVNAGPDKVNSP